MRGSWLVAPMILAACGGSNPEAGAAAVPAACAGERMLVVNNSLNRPVDVYVGNQFLSTAQPGLSEIVLPLGRVRAAYAKIDRTIVQGRDGSTYGPQTPVKFSYRCST